MAKSSTEQGIWALHRRAVRCHHQIIRRRACALVFLEGAVMDTIDPSRRLWLLQVFRRNPWCAVAIESKRL